MPTREEIRKSMFSIKSTKSPGPDGFSSHFFKTSWDLIGSEVCEAVISFFRGGFLLKEWNNTVISLIPKNDVVSSLNDFRPISCCGVLYKCVAKILTERLKKVIGDIICEN